MESRCGVRLLAALYSFQGDGNVTALDTFGPNIYVGFENGAVQKLKITRDGAGQIHTNLLLSATTGKKHKVKRVFHSEVDPLLFVLSHRRLVVLSSDDLSLLREIALDVSAFTVSIADTSLERLHQRQRAKQQQQQSPTSEAPASPVAGVVKPNESPRPVSGSEHQSVRNVEPPKIRSARGTSTRNIASPLAGPADAASAADGGTGGADGRTSPIVMMPTAAAADAAASPRSPPKAGGPSAPAAAAGDAPKIHRICCCLRDERRVVIYELTYDRALRPRKQAKQMASSQANMDESTMSSSMAGAVVSHHGLPPNGRLTRLSKEFLFPERVLTAVECNGVLCVGMAREYSVVSIVDGDAKSLLGLNGEEPAICYFDHEAYLRLNNVLLVTPIRSMPTSSKQALRRTIPFEHRPACFTVRHGLIFAFAKDGCEVYSTYDEDVMQRVPVEDARFVSDRSFKDMIVCASRKHLWLVFLFDLRSRLLEMVSRYRVDDAHDLLMRSGDAARLEAEVKVASGFAHLRHGAHAEAMGYFSSLVDVREVLRYIPGLRPPVFLGGPDNAERRAMEEAVCQKVPGAEVDDAAVKAFLNHAQHPALAACLSAPESLETEEDYWIAWRSHQLHDPELTTLHAAWATYFATLPEVAAADDGTSGGAATRSSSGAGAAAPLSEIRRSWHGRAVTEAQCLRAMNVDLRRCLTEWLEARLLADVSNTATSTTSSDAAPPAGMMRANERRAAEFAYLVLALDSRDSVRVDRFFSAIEPRQLQVRDVLGLLVTRRHFRVLCGILSRKPGLSAAADVVYASYVSQSAVLERRSRFGVRLDDVSAVDAMLGDGTAARLDSNRRGQPLDLSRGYPVWPGRASGSRHPLLFCPPGRYVTGTGAGVLTPPMSPVAQPLGEDACGSPTAAAAASPTTATAPPALQLSVTAAATSPNGASAETRAGDVPAAASEAAAPSSPVVVGTVVDTAAGPPSPAKGASPSSPGSPWDELSPAPVLDAQDAATPGAHQLPDDTADLAATDEPGCQSAEQEPADAAGDAAPEIHSPEKQSDAAAADDEPPTEAAENAAASAAVVEGTEPAAVNEDDVEHTEAAAEAPASPAADAPTAADTTAADDRAGTGDDAALPPDAEAAAATAASPGEAPPAGNEPQPETENEPAAAPTVVEELTGQAPKEVVAVADEEPAGGEAATEDVTAPAVTAEAAPPALPPAAASARVDATAAAGQALPAEHALFIAAEMARVSHVAHLLSTDPTLRDRVGADGSTALHVTLAAPLVGPASGGVAATAAVPSGDVLTLAAFLVARGADVAAVNSVNIPAVVVPFSRRRDAPTDSAASDFATDACGWLPCEASAKLAGAVAAGAAARHPLPL